MPISNPSRQTRLWSAALLCLSLAACGGSSPEDGTVGGYVSGMQAGTSVTLQNNGTDNLTVSSNTTFTFATRIASLSAFSVTVLSQPALQTCSVTRGSGVIPTDGSIVNNVAVTCATSSVGGTVAGLASGASLTLNNGTTDLVVSSNGQFSFEGVLTAGTAYALTISAQPSGQTCTLSNASGVAVDGTMAQVGVSCV